MNYLTNYYKNLSEQLQEKVNLLESYLSQVNEDLDFGTTLPGSSSSTTTNQNQNQNLGLNALLSAWGPVDPNSPNAQFDYNGDGFIDGNDLGVFLANNMSGNRPTTPQLAPVTTAGNKPIPPGSVKVSAMDQAGVANATGVGNAFQTGGPNRPGITPTAEGGPVIRTKVPYAGPGANVGTRQNPPPVPPKGVRKTMTPVSTSIQSGIGELNQVSTTQGIPEMGAETQEEIPYWMSQRTTQTDAGFRAMQRKRKD